MAKKLTHWSAKPIYMGANPIAASIVNGKQLICLIDYLSTFLYNRCMRKRSWTIDQLKNAVKNCFSYRQVLSKLGLREAGGNYEQVKKYISENQLDIKHFKGRGWNAGMHGIGRPHIALEKILIKGSYFQSYKLKQRLFTAGLKPKSCEQCGWAERTDSGHLPLELDHINSDRHDNRLENLRVLCPNCHSLTPNHRGRSLKGTKHARVAKRHTHIT